MLWCNNWKAHTCLVLDSGAMQLTGKHLLEVDCHSGAFNCTVFICKSTENANQLSAGSYKENVGNLFGCNKCEGHCEQMNN